MLARDPTMTISPAHPQPDSLALRLRAGDGAALARLADATYARALAVARALTPDASAAERAVLDAYVALWLVRREAPADAQLESWVLAQVGRALAPRPAARPWTTTLRLALRGRSEAVWELLRARRAAARARCPGLA
jgi:hypothetical protein